MNPQSVATRHIRTPARAHLGGILLLCTILYNMKGKKTLDCTCTAKKKKKRNTHTHTDTDTLIIDCAI